jgi:hypothetical protein
MRILNEKTFQAPSESQLFKKIIILIEGTRILNKKTRILNEKWCIQIILNKFGQNTWLGTRLCPGFESRR